MLCTPTVVQAWETGNTFCRDENTTADDAKLWDKVGAIFRQSIKFLGYSADANHWYWGVVLEIRDETISPIDQDLLKIRPVH